MPSLRDGHPCASCLKLQLPALCTACSSPSALTVRYNLQNVGMEYDRSLFGMKLADCRNLAKVGQRTCSREHGEADLYTPLTMLAQDCTARPSGAQVLPHTLIPPACSSCPPLPPRVPRLWRAMRP